MKILYNYIFRSALCLGGAFFTFVMIGCASVNVVDMTTKGQNEFNEIMVGRSAILTQRNGTSMSVENVHLGTDSTSFYESLSQSDKSIPTARIQSFSFTDHVGGIPRGIFIGAAVGGIYTRTAHPEYRDSDGITQQFSIVQGLLLGGAAGAILGVAIGLERIYEVKTN